MKKLGDHLGSGSFRVVFRSILGIIWGRVQAALSITVKNMLSIVSSIFTLFKVCADESNIGYKMQRISLFKLEKNTKRKILKLNNVLSCGKNNALIT